MDPILQYVATKKIKMELIENPVFVLVPVANSCHLSCPHSCVAWLDPLWDNEGYCAKETGARTWCIYMAVTDSDPVPIAASPTILPQDSQRHFKFCFQVLVDSQHWYYSDSQRTI